MNKRLYLHLLILTFLMVSSGCQQKSVSPEDDNLMNSNLAVLDKTDLEAGIQDATFDNAASFTSPLDRGNFFRHDNDPGRSGRHLYMILRRLSLSEDQVVQVKDFFAGHKTCVAPFVAQFKLIVDPILQELNAQRRLIIQQVQNGQITREQAALRIRELNQAAREQIRNNPDVQELMVDICNCKSALFENIASILTEDQLVIWNEWISNLHNPPCSGD